MTTKLPTIQLVLMVYSVAFTLLPMAQERNSQPAKNFNVIMQDGKVCKNTLKLL